MAAKAKEKTAFTTPDGSFQYTKMPFGMVNPAATYNRMMQNVLKRVDHADSFVDDLIAHTQGWTTHLGCLRETFERISKAGLRVKPSKWQFGFRNLNFVGHTVGSGVLSPGESKVKAVQEASRPLTKRQVKSFLGLVGFFRKYIFASMAVPLTDLTKKGRKVCQMK